MINDKLKVVITGGHFTPGKAVIDVLKEKNIDIYWIGIDKAHSVGDAKSIEAKILPLLGIPFYPINTFKLNRESVLSSLFRFGKMFSGIKQSYKILREIKPDVILSFGSFVSVPVCLTAWILGIPIIVHEQTSASGLANRLVAQLADYVAISFKQSKKYFPTQKTVLTGNPIRAEFFELAQKRGIKKLSKIPVIYITGGSRGSQAINSALVEALPWLTKKYYLIHQMGDMDLERVEKEYKKLKIPKNKYNIQAAFNLEEVEKILSTTDLVVARSGANTVCEVACFGIPAIFIPLPNTEADEQKKNAQILVDCGLAKIINQTDLSGISLLEEIDEMIKNYKKYQLGINKARKLVPIDAANRIVQLIVKVCQ